MHPLVPRGELPQRVGVVAGRAGRASATGREMGHEARDDGVGLHGSGRPGGLAEAQGDLLVDLGGEVHVTDAAGLAGLHEHARDARLDLVHAHPQ